MGRIQQSRRPAIEANKALAKMKSENVKLTFPSLGNYKKISVLAYTDATHASLDEGKSQCAHIIFVKGDNDKIAPISWCSKKIKRVT